MEMIIGNPDVVLQEEDFILESDSTVNLNDELDYATQCKNGEYKIILQLISVLQFGKLGKKLTDRAIDICEHIQNLRLAIYDYKLRVDAAEVGSRKHKTLNIVGVNYLVRYFYLIVFADYLLEQTTRLKRRGRPQQQQAVGDGEVFQLDNNNGPAIKFSEWLEDRREISNILKKMNEIIE